MLKVGQGKAQDCTQQVMIGREEFLEAVSRMGEEVGEGDSLYLRHGGGAGSRRMCTITVECFWWISL